MVLVIPRDARLAEGQQDFSVRAKLSDDVPGFHAGLDCNSYGVFGRGISDPDVAFTVYVHAMRPDEHLSAEAFNDVAVFVELIDRVVGFEFTVGIHTVDPETAASSDWNRVGLIASNESPDAFAVDVDVHRSRRSHLSPAWKPGPLASGDARSTSIRKSPDGSVGIVS